MAEEQKPLSSRLSGSLLSSPESEVSKWRRMFDRHAKEGPDGVKYLEPSSFIDAVAPTEEGFNRISRQQYSILFKVADSSNRGRITFDEFVVFETLLKRPDADYQLAFRVFDVNGSGQIDYDQFKAVLSANLAASEIPFDYDCDWIKLYLGQRGGNHIVGFQEFAQLLKGFRGERVRQAFRYFDTDNDGFIAPSEFQKIMVEIAGHKLSDSVIQRLPTLSLMTPGQRISYSEVFAFHNIIRELDAVEKTIQRAVRKAKDGKIDITDFLNEAATARNSVFTPLEASIIFYLASRGAHETVQRLGMADFDALLDAKWSPPATTVASTGPTTPTSALSEIAGGVYDFVQGGIAGAVGAFVVFPIDLVKTRIQNQRSNVVGEVLYKNPWHCAQTIYRHEGGIRGFYRGTVPQMIGVAPEKSIKLVVNSFVRSKLTNPETGRIAFSSELIAGGSAGGAQVLITNPLEVVKIRLQMAGEMARSEPGVKPLGVISIIRGLGLVGLYKGTTACLARDIPFSMIYFPVYAHMKKDVFHEGRQGKVLSLGELLISAGVGGIPAAWITTAPDVAKTRLQSQARAGETQYKGTIDAIRTIAREEGVKALFKGSLFRVARSSPQFAVTLTVFEVLSRQLPNPFSSKTSPNQGRPVSSTPDISRVRARNALRILLDCSSTFGMVKPDMAAKGVQNLPKSLRSSTTVGKELA